MKYILLLALVFCLAILPAIVVNHIPPLGFEPNQQQEIKLEVLQNWTELTEAVMYFRVQDTANYEQIIMVKEIPEGPWLSANLPVTTSPDKGYEYYFKFTMQNGSVETLPMVEADLRPYLINPQAKTGEETAGFILLSDDPIIMAKDGYTLAVSWFALDGDVDNATIAVFVNGKDVTNRTELSTNVLLYLDKAPRPGQTTAFVTAKTIDGKELHSATWTTVIKASGDITTLPMNLRGSVNAGTSVYTSEQDSSAVAFGSDTDDGWASVDLYGDYKKLSLNAYSYISTLENAQAQAVNRYRFGFMLPMWETYAGDYAPNITTLTMSNKNLRGLYSSFNSSYFGMTLAHGEMLRAVDGTKYMDGDSTRYNPGTFKQEALAARMRLGNEKGFYLAFNTTRNRDIITSLDRQYVVEDTTQIAFPVDNLVFSMDARLNMPGQNTMLGIEGAGSLYNRNTLPGAMTKDELTTYLGDNTDAPIDPSNFEDFFIINTNMQPLPISGSIKDPLAFAAWTAYYRSFWFNNLLNISYSHVGASYKALSANYLQQDATQLAITEQYNYKQFFFITGGFNQTKDNLAKHQLETNTFDSYFAQGLVRIPKYPYLSIAYTGSKGKNEKNDKIDSDDVSLYNPYKRASQQIAVGLGYDFEMLPVAPTNLSVGYKLGNDNEQRLDILGRFADVYDNDNSNISLNLTSKFIAIPLKTQLSLSSNQQDANQADESKSNMNLMAKGEYRLLQNRVLPWVEFRTTSLGGDQQSQAYNYFTLGVLARPLPDTNIETSLGWKSYNNNDRANVNYDTTTWRLNLSQRF